MMKMKNQYFLMTVTAMAKRYDNISNNNNNRPFLYCAFHARGASQSTSDIITPGHCALNHSLGSIQPWAIYALLG